MNRFVGFFRFYTENTLERTSIFATLAEAQAAVVARMNNDPRILEGFVVKIMTKSERDVTIVTQDFGP